MSIDLNAPEVQEAIKAAVESAVEARDAEVSERIGALSKENAKWRRLAQGKDQPDPEAVAKLEEQIEALKGDLATAQKAAKTATADSEKVKKALSDAEGFTQRLLVDNGLNDALAKAGVTNPVHLKAVKSMLAGQVQIVAEGDQKVAKVGDKALADFVTDWSKGDEGKHFVAAPNNSGGGAGGGGGGSGTTKGDFGGDKAARTAAIAAKFPQLNQS